MGEKLLFWVCIFQIHGVVNFCVWVIMHTFVYECILNSAVNALHCSKYASMKF